MKRFLVVLAAFLLVFAFIGCGGDSIVKAPTTSKYEFKDSDGSVRLVVTDSSAAAAYKPKGGDKYEFTYAGSYTYGGKKYTNTLIGTGTVDSFVGGLFALTDTEGNSFTVTVEEYEIVGIEGRVYFEKGTTTVTFDYDKYFVGFVHELGDYHTGTTWMTDGTNDTETDLPLETLQESRYLILEVTSIAGQNGFGGLQIGLQGDVDAWAWHQYISPDWTGMNDLVEYGDDDDFYIVIRLDSMADWSAVKVGTQIKIIMNTIPSQITINGGYLTNTRLSPASDAVEFSKDYSGWATKDLGTLLD